MRGAGEQDVEDPRILLGLLDAVGQERAQSQRLLASELGIALGLVNAYLKRCVKKGLVKVSEAPARRYAYYLTPQGFAEKSRLTVEYLSASFSFFRRAKTDCTELFQSAIARSYKRIVLVGQSELAEIAALCALESDIEIVGIVEVTATSTSFVGLPVFSDFDSVSKPFDAVFITDLGAPGEVSEMAVARFGIDRVLVPELLRLRLRTSDQGRQD